MTVTIDRARALQLLDDVVAEKGADYKYEHLADTSSCYYLHDEQPGCIIGHVLVNLGVPLDAIRHCEGSPATGVDWQDLGYGLADGAGRIFYEAQSAQDAGATWGDALDIARHALDPVTA